MWQQLRLKCVEFLCSLIEDDLFWLRDTKILMKMFSECSTILKNFVFFRAPGGPSARSGHRMAHVKRQLFIFGGFHDNLRDYKYYNDLHIFDLTNYQWSKLVISGNVPAPRSGCVLLPTAQNTIAVWGGYSKERIKKDVDKGHVHTDMFVLAPDSEFAFAPAQIIFTIR